MPKITVPADEMRDLLYGEDVIRDRITSHGRWSVGHELIFRREGKLYLTRYSVGATESQDERPWENDSTVGCVEVAPVEVTVTEYKAVE